MLIPGDCYLVGPVRDSGDTGIHMSHAHFLRSLEPAWEAGRLERLEAVKLSGLLASQPEFSVYPAFSV